MTQHSHLNIKDKEVDFLVDLLSYVTEDDENLERVMTVIGNALEAKYMTVSYVPMTNEEALTPEMGEFRSRLTTIVDNGIKTLLLARSSSDWVSPCKVSFGVMASLIRMVQNDVMNHCSEESMDSYKDFIRIIRQSAIAGTDAISCST